MRLPCQEGYDVTTEDLFWRRMLVKTLLNDMLLCAPVIIWNLSGFSHGKRTVVWPLAMCRNMAMFGHFHKIWTTCWILLFFVPRVHFYQGIFNHFTVTNFMRIRCVLSPLLPQIRPGIEWFSALTRCCVIQGINGNIYLPATNLFFAGYLRLAMDNINKVDLIANNKLATPNHPSLGSWFFYHPASLGIPHDYGNHHMEVSMWYPHLWMVYPLVIFYIVIENCHRNSGFTH